MDNEIDLLKYFEIIKKNKSTFIKACLSSMVFGLIITFFIPKQYSTEVVLAPESSSGNPLGSLSGMASVVGINLGKSSSATDAITPEIYPNVINSDPFIIKVLESTVTPKDSSYVCTVQEYFNDHYPVAFWNRIIGSVLLLFQNNNMGENANDQGINAFRMTEAEYNTVKALAGSISCNVDKKTDLITIKVSMPDPLVSAQVAQSVSLTLQEYITEYRIKKEKAIQAYWDERAEEAKQNYAVAVERYTKFADSNINIIKHSSRAKENDLENEKDLAFSLYKQIIQQQQLSKAKVLEKKPVYTVVKPATVPLRAYSPRKLIFMIGFGIFAFLITFFVLIINGFKKDTNVNAMNVNSKISES